MYNLIIYKLIGFINNPSKNLNKTKINVMCMENLSIKEIHDRLQELNGWEMSDYSSIYKEFEFDNFKEAMEFAQKVGEEASHQYHYPDILIRNNKVTITLTTPEDGGLTYKDFKMAKIIEQLV